MKEIGWVVNRRASSMYTKRVVYQAMVYGKDARKQKAPLILSNEVICKHSDRAAEMYEMLMGGLHCCETNLYNGASAIWAPFH